MGSPLKFETRWLREFARTYLPCDAELDFCPEQFRRARVDIVDLTCLFRRGRVVRASKLDTPGALWVVEGEDCDGSELRAILVVISDEMSVRIEDIERVEQEEPGNDAA